MGLKPLKTLTRKWAEELSRGGGLLCSSALVPEVVGRQLFYQGSCQPLAQHQQKRDDDVMVALVVVQLRVALQDEEYDVNQLLLELCSLLFRHAWAGREGETHLDMASRLATPTFGGRWVMDF